MMSPVALTTSRITSLTCVGDEQVARGVDGNAEGPVELCGGRWPIVAAVTLGSVAGDGDDVAGRLDHLANDVVVSVGDELVARGVDGDALRGSLAPRRSRARCRRCIRRYCCRQR